MFGVQVSASSTSRSGPPGSSRHALAADISLHPRLEVFGFTVDTPHYWVRGDAFQTHFFNAFFSFTPGVERFTARTIRRARAHVSDPALKRCIELFLIQEVRHGREHDKYNAMLDGRGYRVTRMSRWADLSLRLVAKRASLLTAVAVCVAFEHVAALMVDMLSEVSVFGSADNDVMRLAHWHAVEEVEHRGVALDVYHHLGGGYAMRVLVAVLVCVPFLPKVLRRQCQMLATDRTLFQRRTWRNSWSFLFGPRGQARIFGRGFRALLRRDFSPWSHHSHLDTVRMWDVQHAAPPPPAAGSAQLGAAPRGRPPGVPA